MKFAFTSLLIILFSFSVFAQKKYIKNEEQAQEYINTELDNFMQSEDITKFKEKNKITGTYKFEFVLYKNGKVESVNIVERKEGDIPSQNAVRNLVRSLKFKIKMPKEHRFKVVYTFNFNS